MTDILRALSDGLSEAVQRVAPSVVRVDARRRMAATGVIWDDQGLVVTAHHVLERDEPIQVSVPEGGSIDARLVGRDATTDLALLRLSAAGHRPAEWRGSDEVRAGHLVMALGRPGEGIQATFGIISALGDPWRTPAGGQVDRYLQPDLVMPPGFSGGPLVSVSGEVLGVNTSALLRGLPLTVPTATVRRVVAALAEHGRIRRGYLGIGAQPVRLPEDLARELGQAHGLLLVSVEPDTPAAAAGLTLGDTIVSLDGSPVRDLDDVLALLTVDRVGRRMAVRFVRGGKTEERAVLVSERAA